MRGNLIRVGDFYYDSKKAAALASKELEAVEYMRANLDLGKPEEIFEAYEQMIEKKVFHTEIGYFFLKDLHDYLSVYATLVTKLSPVYDMERSAIAREPEKKGKKGKAERFAALEPRHGDDYDEKRGLRRQSNREKGQEAAIEVLSGGTKDAAEKWKAKKAKRADKKAKSAKERLAQKEQMEALKQPVSYIYKELFYLTLTFCIVFLIAIACMFYITSTSGNINIINYENEIIDKYSGWEQELSDREKELDTWQKELEDKMNK